MPVYTRGTRSNFDWIGWVCYIVSCSAGCVEDVIENEEWVSIEDECGVVDGDESQCEGAFVAQSRVAAYEESAAFGGVGARVAREWEMSYKPWVREI